GRGGGGGRAARPRGDGRLRRKVDSPRPAHGGGVDVPRPVLGPRPHHVLAVGEPCHLTALAPPVVVETALEGRAGLARDREGGVALVRDVRRAVFDGCLRRMRVDGPLAARGGGVAVSGAVDGPHTESVRAVIQPRIGLGRRAGLVGAVVELALEGRVLLARGEPETVVSVGGLV